jgi:hypothetical protein
LRKAVPGYRLGTRKGLGLGLVGVCLVGRRCPAGKVHELVRGLVWGYGG